MTDEEKAKAEAEEKAKAENKGPSKLMRAAMDAFGLRPGHILDSRDYDDHVVIVTKGGKKLSFAPGDKVKELAEVDKHGLPAKKKK